MPSAAETTSTQGTASTTPKLVDVVEWQRRNRIKLLPGRQYRWVLCRTDRDHPGEDTIERTARAVLGRWVVDSDVQSYEHVDEYKPTSTALRRDALPGPLPTVRFQRRPIWVVLVWSYRGAKELDVPWPTRRATTFDQKKADADCPVDADWMLAESEDKAIAPVSETVAEKLARAVTSGVDHAAKRAFTGAGIAVVAIAVIVALLFVLSRSKSSEEKPEGDESQ